MEHSNKEDELTTTSSNSVSKNLMTQEEKLSTIKKEVQTLYEFCTSKGFSETDMSMCLAPFAGNPPERVTRACKTNVRFLFGVAVVVGILAAVMYTDAGYNVFCIHGKIVIMQVVCEMLTRFLV